MIPLTIKIKGWLWGVYKSSEVRTNPLGMEFTTPSNLSGAFPIALDPVRSPMKQGIGGKVQIPWYSKIHANA